MAFGRISGVGLAPCALRTACSARKPREADRCESQPAPPGSGWPPLEELNAYAIYEHELETLANGSAGSSLLSISYALLPFSGTLAIAIFGTEMPLESHLRWVRPRGARDGLGRRDLPRPRLDEFPEQSASGYRDQAA